MENKFAYLVQGQFVYLVQGHFDNEGVMLDATKVFATYEDAYEYGETLKDEFGIDLFTVDKVRVNWQSDILRVKVSNLQSSSIVYNSHFTTMIDLTKKECIAILESFGWTYKGFLNIGWGEKFYTFEDVAGDLRTMKLGEMRRKAYGMDMNRWFGQQTASERIAWPLLLVTSKAPL